MKQLVALFSLACAINSAAGQTLTPGFDRLEYLELLRLNATLVDSTFNKSVPKPKQFRWIYRSPLIGLDNRWALAIDKNNTAVIAIRGTTNTTISWINNFYAAMTPAIGWCIRQPGDTFKFHLAENRQAAVHIGWLTSLAYLCKDILPKIDSLYLHGSRDILITGHSQGGAIAYLLTAHLRRLQASDSLPKDIRFKTYCSAAPKPGNLFFAYDYERMTRHGWAFNVINTADWVPETPVSVQTLRDLNPVNPFADVRTIAKTLPFPKNIMARILYAQLSKPSLKAQRRNNRYLGKYLARTVKKHLPLYQPPPFFPSSNYIRTGITIVLKPDSMYSARQNVTSQNLFIHHLFSAYYNLALRDTTIR